MGSSATAEVRLAEYPLEKQVSDAIRGMPLLWLDVDDPPGPTSSRGVIESGSISLLSNLSNPHADPPSPTWLGHFADRADVRSAGLWNVRHVSDPPDLAFLDLLERGVEMTEGGSRG